MTKYIVNSFYFFYGVSKFDFNCNFLNPSKDIHTYIHTTYPTFFNAIIDKQFEQKHDVGKIGYAYQARNVSK